MAIPGWYPDPCGDYHHRYWDGTRWTDDVATNGHQLRDPIGDGAVPTQEQLLWTHELNQLSTHRVWINDGVFRGRATEFALWQVAEVDVTVNAGQHALGTGRIAFRIAFPGYVGRTHYVMSGVPSPHEVGGLAHKWANRNRRAVSG